MSLVAVLLTALNGFQVTWDVEPAHGQAPGSVSLRVVLDGNDLVFVHEDGVESASWEAAVSLDGSLADRVSGTVSRENLPVEEDLIIDAVPAGDHVLVVLAGDLETRRRFTWEEDIHIPLIDSTCWSSGSLQITGGQFQRAVGETGLFWSVYPPISGGLPDSVGAAWVLRDDDGVVRREGWMDTELQEGRFRCGTAMPVDGLAGGGYEVLAALVADGEVVSASRAEIDLLQDWDVWGDDGELTMSLVRPIASVSELASLDQADGPASRNAAMAEFWQERDPSPGTVRNEFLEEYLARLDYIEEHFSIHSSLGITSDQGRVYALLGQPDIVDDMPLELSTLPVQVWVYFSPPLEVVFVDHDGYGSYDLSNDWEEVSNARERN
jgi:GWxTD domain-containing protein